MAVYESRLVWVNGPQPAGTPDITVYRQSMKDVIPAGKRVIADKGYRGEPHTISTPSRLDPPELRKFKGRARARHETLNSRLKQFLILDDRFRHSLEKHRMIFESICVIVQFQMENWSPLFEV